MRKIVLISFLGLAALQACKKEDNVSKVVQVSYPTIHFLNTDATGDNLEAFYGGMVSAVAYVSLPVGASVDLTPTSSSGEAVEITTDGALDVNTPGLYIYELSTKNQNGYGTIARYYVAVTNEQNNMLEGKYYSDYSEDTVRIESLAPGLYLNMDAAGDAFGVNALFVHVNSNTVLLPEQPTDLDPNTDSGPFAWDYAELSLSPDTTIRFNVINDYYAPEDTVTITLVAPL